MSKGMIKTIAAYAVLLLAATTPCVAGESARWRTFESGVGHVSLAFSETGAGDVISDPTFTCLVSQRSASIESRDKAIIARALDIIKADAYPRAKLRSADMGAEALLSSVTFSEMPGGWTLNISLPAAYLDFWAWVERSGVLKIELGDQTFDLLRTPLNNFGVAAFLKACGDGRRPP